MNRKSKGIIAITAAVAAVIVAVVAAVLITRGGSRGEYREHLELGSRYLEELEYEQAIVELRAAIEIEPNDSEAYLILSEVYVAMGDYENAIAVLEEGYAATGDEEIGDEIDRLRQEYGSQQENISQESMSSANQENSTADSGTEQTYRSELDRLVTEGADDLPYWEELTWFGNHISTLDYETAKALLLENGFQAGPSSEQDNDEYLILVDMEYGDGGTNASVLQYKSESRVGMLGLQHFDFYDGPVYTTDIRGITLRDSLGTVLDKLGFSNADEIVTYIGQGHQAVYADYEEFAEATENNLWMFRENDEVGIYFQCSMESLEGGGYRLGNVEIHIDFNFVADDRVGGGLWLGFNENDLLEDVNLHNNNTN